MPQPLAGIRVLEFGNFIAGPLCGMLLADMGAEVIKVEPVRSGDMSRATPPFVGGESSGFLALNRNKKSIALDLRQPQAVDVVRKLAAETHVFLENYRPGVLARMGLGAQQMKALNPTIAYVSVSGFGQTGPYRERSAVNLIIEAFSGSLSITGEPGEAPMRPGLQTGDVLGAMFAVYATLCALLGRFRHGHGRIVDLSLVEASISSAIWEVAEYLSTGNVPLPLGRRHRLTAPYQLFQATDGAYLAIGTPNNELFTRLMKVLGCEAAVADPRFATYALRKENEAAIVALVEGAVHERESHELERALMAVGVPCARVNNYAEVLNDEHIVARALVAEVEHPTAGKLRVLRNPVRFDQDGPAVARPAPLLGEHTAEVLHGLGYASETIKSLEASGIIQCAPVTARKEH